MTDYRALYGKEYLGAWDLPRDVTLTIASVSKATLRATDEKKKPDTRPILTFEKTDRKLVLNVTNGSIVAGMYGVQVEKWKGKRITLFATTCMSFGKMTDCIRVRPKIPKSAAAGTIDDAPDATTHIDEPAHEVAPEIDPLVSDENGEVPGV